VGDNSHYMSGELPVCEPCWEKKNAGICWKCRHRCHGSAKAILALERTWCSTCFACEECTTPFDEGEFVLREDGTLVCETCELRHLKSSAWNC
jgi:hypothetical protein